MHPGSVLKFVFFLIYGLGASAAFADGWKNSVHGDLELDSTEYKDTLAPTNKFLETGRFSLDVSLKHAKDFRIKLHPLLQADPLNDSISERYWIDAPEGYLQFQESGTTVQMGLNTFTWGVTDGYNPLDVVSARRYQEPLKPDKLGAPSLLVKKDVGNVSFEAIYIPFQRKSILPGINSRWLPRQVYTTTSIPLTGGQIATVNLPPDLNFHYEQDHELDRALENNVGVRMQVNGLADGLDLSLEGFEGAASTPAVQVNAGGSGVFTSQGLVIQASSFVDLTPYYYRQQVVGGSLVYANFGMIFRTEVAVTRIISKGLFLPGHSEAYIFGIEKPIPIGAHDLTLLLAATYGRHEDPLSNSTTSIGRVFDRAGVLGARYNFTEKFAVLLSGVWDTESHGELAHVEGSYALTDAWKLGVSGDAIWGNAATPLGSYNKNDRVIGSIMTAF